MYDTSAPKKEFPVSIEARLREIRRFCQAHAVPAILRQYARYGWNCRRTS